MALQFQHSVKVTEQTPICSSCCQKNVKLKIVSNQTVWVRSIEAELSPSIGIYITPGSFTGELHEIAEQKPK